MYPGLCAGCGMAARTELTIEKVFERNSSDDTPRGYVVGEVRVPFYPTCIARHEIIRRFDFSDDLSEPFDQPRRTYTSLNPAFADAFHALNRERVWDPSSVQAIRASRHRGIVVAMLLVAMVIVAFHEEIKRLAGW
jgi:hypothetical protein